MSERISVRPTVRFGKPCVVGTRITVQEVLELVREQIGNEEIRAKFYPELTDEDVRACVQYAIDLIDNEEIHLAESA